MENLKRTLIVLAFSTLTLLSFGQNSFDILTIRIYEGNNAYQCKIIVADGEKVLETIDLPVALSAKNWEQNQVLITKTLKKHLDNGYKIFSSVSGGNAGMIFTTYLLSKE